MVLRVGEKGIPLLGLAEHFAERHVFVQAFNCVRLLRKEFNADRRYVEVKLVENMEMFFCECHMIRSIQAFVVINLSRSS
jgi:hypothetical protein